MKLFSDKDLYRHAFVQTVPVLSGYLVMGTGFGMLLQANGYGLLWSLAMAVSIFSGSMQYVAVGLLAAQAPLPIVALTTLLVNARYMFYGISTAEKYKGVGWKKFFLMFVLTDETYAIVCRDDIEGDRRRRQKFYTVVSLFDYCYWIAGCVLGSLFGKLLPISTKGVEFVLTALYLTIFIDQWKETKKHLPALIGVGASLVCLLVFGSEIFLLPAMAITALCLCAVSRKEPADE